MQKFVNGLRGSVRVELTGLHIERIFNLFSRRGIEFWDAVRTGEGSMQMTLKSGKLDDAEEIARKLGCGLRVTGKMGLPAAAKGFRKRYVLVLGVMAALVMMLASGFRVWRIDVIGSSSLSEAEILAALERAGVSIGCKGLDISAEKVRNSMLLELPELMWMTINVKGSVAEVIVRETTPKPEIFDARTPSRVISTKTGAIDTLDAYMGTALYEPGDVVTQGETVVTGIRRLANGEVRISASLAELKLRTWYSLSASIPLNVSMKLPTGEVKTQRELLIFGKCIKLDFSSGIPGMNCDKIESEKSVPESLAFALPLTVRRTDYIGYETYSAKLSEDEAEKLLTEELLDELSGRIGDSGQVVSVRSSCAVKDGVMTLSLHAECLEPAGMTVPYTEEELVLAKSQEGALAE